MGCQVAVADKIVEHKGDYLLALKGNQPTLEAEVADYFNSAPAEELVVKDAKLKGARPCIEMRTYTASSNVDWIVSTGSLTERPVTGASRACTGCPTSSSGRSLALPQRSRRQDRAIVRCFVLRSCPCQQVQAQRQNTQKVSKLGHVLLARTAAQMSVNPESVPCGNDVFESLFHSKEPSLEAPPYAPGWGEDYCEERAERD
jgi:hypothetical protein